MSFFIDKIWNRRTRKINRVIVNIRNSFNNSSIVVIPLHIQRICQSCHFRCFSQQDMEQLNTQACLVLQTVRLPVNLQPHPHLDIFQQPPQLDPSQSRNSGLVIFKISATLSNYIGNFFAICCHHHLLKSFAARRIFVYPLAPSVCLEFGNKALRGNLVEPILLGITQSIFILLMLIFPKCL